MTIEQRNEKRSSGLCMDCTAPVTPGRSLCVVHMASHRASQQARSRKRIDAGVCVSCGVKPTVDGTARCVTCRSKQNASSRRHNRQEKQDVVDAYGGACACCGERTYEFLSVDHINNDGAEHRRQLNQRGGKSIYVWLKANGYPKDNFQLLCFNCNCAKAFYSVCPHQLALAV